MISRGGALTHREMPEESSLHKFHRHQIAHTIPGRITKNSGGGATKPSCAANGVNGNAAATSTTVSEVTVSAMCGLLFDGLPRVRITKITSTCVAMDSMNQPVWNSSSSAPKTFSRMKNVRKSNN